MRIKEIEKSVSEIRKDFEEGKVNYNNLKILYQDYNKIDDINNFIDKSKSLFPNLNCGLASLYIINKLRQGRIIKGKHKNDNHTFVLLKKDIIIDITSDQYGGPKVYIGELKEPWRI